MLRRSVVSDSLRSHGLQPTKFLCPWGFSRQLEWVAMPFSRGSSEPRDRTQVSHIQADSLSIELPRRAGRVDLAQFLRAQVRFPGGSDSKESACNAEDLGSIPGSGRSPGEGHGNPLQYSCLGNPMDRGAWWAVIQGVAKSQVRLAD